MSTAFRKLHITLTQTCNARVKFDLIDRWGAFPGGRSSTQSVRAAGQCHWRGHRSDWIILGTNFSSGRKIPQWYRLFLPFELSCSLYEYYNIACAILDSYNGYNQLLLQMKIWSILTLFFNKRRGFIKFWSSKQIITLTAIFDWWFVSATILSQPSSSTSPPFKATAVTSSIESDSPTHKDRKTSRRISAKENLHLLDRFRKHPLDDMSPPGRLSVSPMCTRCCKSFFWVEGGGSYLDVFHKKRVC